MKKRRGVSLIELVLTVALLGLVIQVVYSVFFVGSTSYSVSTNKGFSQQDVRIAADFITKELKTATEIGIDLENKNGFYSLEIESAGARGNLVKYFNQLDDKGTIDTTDDELVKTPITSFSGNWKKFELSNSNAGIIGVSISQDEGSGNGKSGYSISFSIDLINNTSEINAFSTTDLVSGSVLYYRNEPINLKVNGIHVKPESLDSGEVLRTLTFRDSINTEYVYNTFTAVGGTPIEKPAPNPTKTGYTFTGWFSASDGSGLEYTSWSAMPDNDFTLYAKWELNSPTTPTINTVKIIKIEGKKSPTIVNISPNNINYLKFEKNKLHKITIEISGQNLDTVTVKVNANSPIIESRSSTQIIVQYSFTTPNNNNDGVIRVVMNEDNSKPYLFNYTLVNKGDY